MRRLFFVLAMLLMASGCQAPFAATPRTTTPESVALRAGDISGFQRCGESGDVDAVLKDQRSTNPSEYDVNATEWAQWRMQGASDAYLAAYGRTASDCAALSAAGTGAPSGGMVVGLVVKFKNPATAQRTYSASSTLLGFGPKDTTFITLVGGMLMTGSATGLGPQSVVGSGTAIGASYFVAFWQNKAFDSFLIAYDVNDTVARIAAEKMNARIG